MSGKILTILKMNHFNMKYLGFVHFNITDLPKSRPSFSKTSILAHLLHLTYGAIALVFFPKYFSLFDSDSTISNLICFVTGLLTVITGLDNIFWSKIHQKDIFKLFKCFYELDVGFQNASIDLNYKKVTRIGGILMLIDLLQILSLMVMHTIFDKDTVGSDFQIQPIIVFLFVFIFWSQETFFCQYLLFSNTAKLMLERTDEELRRKYLTIEKFLICYDFYSELCDVIRLMNKLYTIQILLQFVSSFVLMTLEVYGGLVDEYDMATSTLLSSLYGGVLMIYKMLVLIFLAEELKNSANKIRQTLVKLVVTRKEKKERKEVKFFLLYILHSEVKVSCGGLFELNYRLGVNIFTSIVMYIIILIQTDPNGSKKAFSKLFN